MPGGSVDFDYGLYPAPIAAPPPLDLSPPPVAVPAPAAGNTPAVGSTPTTDQFTQWLLNSPLYKQGMETLAGDFNTNMSRMQEMSALESRLSTGASWTPITIPQSFYEQLALQKEKAGHDNALALKAIPEIMAGRGMLSSGQTGFELGEQEYNYDTMLKDIALTQKSREEETAQSNARGAADAARVNANAAVQRQMGAKQDEYRMQDMRTQLARDTGSLFNNVADYYKTLWWNEATGQYEGPTLP